MSVAFTAVGPRATVTLLPGSVAFATRCQTTVVRDPATTGSPTWVHPAGAAGTVVLLTEATATNPSPACVVAGIGVTTLVELVTLPVESRYAIGLVAPSITTSVVVDAGAPSSSVTVRVTGYVPGAAYPCSACTPLAVPPSPKLHW